MGMRRALLLLVAFAAAAMLGLGGVAVAQTAPVGEPQLDQESTGGVSSLADISNCKARAHTFTAGRTGVLTKASLYLSHWWTDNGPDPTSPLTVDVREVTTAGAPEGDMFGEGGTVLASGQVTYDAIPAYPGGWVEIAFSPSTGMVSGEKYALVASSDTPCIQTGPYFWGADGADPEDEYPRGEMWNYFTEYDQEWTPTPVGTSLYFRTYVSLDTEAPTGSVAINGGKRRTSSRTITLALGATDPSPGTGVDSMRIKNAGGSWTAWQPYAESKGWKLTRGAGKKTVYAQYRDAAGNVSAKASDSITYRP